MSFHKKRSDPQHSTEAVERRRASQAEARRAQTAAGQEIGDIPPCADPLRRERCKQYFANFDVVYFPHIFSRPFSKDLRAVCAKIERVVKYGECLAHAMPRGAGKTSLSQAAILWGILCWGHKFAILIGATASDGDDAMEWFKSALLTNDLLCADFPEVCYPIRCMNGEARRCMGQRYQGERTNIKWGADRIVLPTIPGSEASGSIIGSTSIEGKIRGARLPIPGGKVARPTLAMIDDPQTDESAVSQGIGGQTQKRLNIINRAVRGLAGGDRPVGILIPCTVICQGDLADQILDHTKYPHFRGERRKRVYAWPTNSAIVEQYREMHLRAILSGDYDESLEFYRSKMCDRGRMVDDDAAICADCPRKADCIECGAIVDDPYRLDDPRNLSAVQAALHKKWEMGDAAFASEFQNEPLANEGLGLRLTPHICMSRISGRPQYEIPPESIELTCGVDVQQWSLWYAVVAWQQNFTGHVVDYGIWPSQQRLAITKEEIQNSQNNLTTMYPGRGIEGTIQAGLDDFISRMLSRNFVKSGGGGLMRITRMLVDSGKWANVIHAVKLARGGAVMTPSKGVGIKAGTAPMASRKRKEGERWDALGHWYTPVVTGTREFPYVAIDVNWWKSFVHGGLLTAPGDPGSITLFGHDQERHAMFASHLTAEAYVTPTSPRGVPVDEWSIRPGNPDNEMLDCMVLTAVGASMQGCRRGVVTAQKQARIVNRPVARWEKKNEKAQV